MPDAGPLAALRALAPGAAGCGWADPRLDHGLLPGERLPSAIPARLREFSAGRAAARAALAELGLPPTSIPHGPDRAPVWPDGIIGSITHTSSECLAIVLPKGAVSGIGIDLEEEAPLSPSLWHEILDVEERAALSRLPQCHQAAAALRWFSAKEAAYKAQYPVTGALLEFHDLSLRFHPDGFDCLLQRPVPPLAQGSTITGRMCRVAGHVLTLATL